MKAEEFFKQFTENIVGVITTEIKYESCGYRCGWHRGCDPENDGMHKKIEIQTIDFKLK